MSPTTTSLTEEMITILVLHTTPQPLHPKTRIVVVGELLAAGFLSADTDPLLNSTWTTTMSGFGLLQLLKRLPSQSQRN